MNYLRPALLALALSIPSYTRNRILPVRHFSEPDWITSGPSPRIVPVHLFSIHSLKGKIGPHREPLPISNDMPKEIKVGGLEVMGNYLQIIRKRMGSNAILVDTGHIFNTTTEDRESFDIIKNFYERHHFNSVVLTEKELLSRQMLETAKIPFLASNIIDIKTGKSLEGVNLIPWNLIETAGVKVGLIGVTLFDSIASEDREKINGIIFEDPVLAFIKSRKKLLDLGAEILILLVHSEGSPKLDQMIKRLPPDSVDLIVSDEEGFPMLHETGTPLLKTPREGRFIGRASFLYDTKTKKIINPKDVLLSPIKLCHQFFVGTEDCHQELENTKYKKARQESIENAAYQMMPASF